MQTWTPGLQCRKQGRWVVSFVNCTVIWFRPFIYHVALLSSKLSDHKAKAWSGLFNTISIPEPRDWHQFPPVRGERCALVQYFQLTLLSLHIMLTHLSSLFVTEIVPLPSMTLLIPFCSRFWAFQNTSRFMVWKQSMYNTSQGYRLRSIQLDLFFFLFFFFALK